MNFYRAYKLGRIFLAGGMVIVVGCIGVIIITIRSIREELDFHVRYGSAWVQQYEAAHGSLVRANVKIALGIAYLMGLVTFLLWVYLRNRPGGAHRRRHRHHH